MLSVVIPTCHRNDLLAKCLDRLAPGRQSISIDRYEVIVTDDGSISTARELVERDYPWVTWRMGPKRGPAANRNNGAKAARGQWLVFTDDDCIPDLLWLEEFWKVAKNQEAQVLEGRTSPTGIRYRVDMDCPVNESGGYLWSCNMAILKDLFVQLNGFDDRFPGPTLEDIDLRTRLGKSGKRFKFVPSALVLHPWRPKRGFAFCKFQSQTMAYFIKKHPEAADKVSFKTLSIELAHKLIKQVPPPAFTCRGRGLGRELALILYVYYISIVEFVIKGGSARN
jgi:GT2 family glycosyltransferase